MGLKNRFNQLTDERHEKYILIGKAITATFFGVWLYRFLAGDVNLWRSLYGLRITEFLQGLFWVAIVIACTVFLVYLTLECAQIIVGSRDAAISKEKRWGKPMAIIAYSFLVSLSIYASIALLQVKKGDTRMAAVDVATIDFQIDTKRESIKSLETQRDSYGKSYKNKKIQITREIDNITDEIGDLVVKRSALLQNRGITESDLSEASNNNVGEARTLADLDPAIFAIVYIAFLIEAGLIILLIFKAHGGGSPRRVDAVSKNPVARPHSPTPVTAEEKRAFGFEGNGQRKNIHKVRGIPKNNAKERKSEVFEYLNENPQSSASELHKVFHNKQGGKSHETYRRYLKEWQSKK